MITVTNYKWDRDTKLFELCMTSIGLGYLDELHHPSYHLQGPCPCCVYTICITCGDTAQLLLSLQLFYIYIHVQVLDSR